MQSLHVGSGTSRGALTVFPVWGEYAGPRGYSVEAKAAVVTEQATGPAVATLTTTNTGTRPLLMLEGQLLEGGWQNRLVGRSVLVPAHTSVDLEVLCVEAGRWSGEAEHRWNERRASLRLRSALVSDQDRQGEVWRRVGEYEAHYGRQRYRLVRGAHRPGGGRYRRTGAGLTTAAGPGGGGCRRRRSAGTR